MRVVVIGATGHVGTYMIPRLVEAGHEVIALSRGQKAPYQSHPAWKFTQQISIDRAAEDADGTFGGRIRDLKPDVVIDMICFTLSSAQHLVEALRGEVQHFLHCGTIWAHGFSVEVPTVEEYPRHPLEEYGIQKWQIESYLLDEARRNGFPATVLMPGHIVGKGWTPINPLANVNPEVFATLARGETLALPNFGLETVHHVHADDVAQVFMQAIANWNNAVGENFHAVSRTALTLRGYAEAVAGWFGQTAQLKYLAWEEWRTTVSEVDAAATWGHIARSSNCSIAKAQRLLGYQPRYTSLQAIHESVFDLIERGVIKI
jgi:nucleoside-diphosphate-sugar epimerase